MNRKRFLICLFGSFGIFTWGQSLLVKHYDEQNINTSVDTLLLGDFVVIKHGLDNKTAHYFQGKITGLFKKDDVIRIFDYARTTRVMPLVGKKIKLSEILAVAKLDDNVGQGRQDRATSGTTGEVIGSLLGGTAGTVVGLGSAFSKGASDGLSRKKIDSQNIKCEIIEN